MPLEQGLEFIGDCLWAKSPYSCLEGRKVVSRARHHPVVSDGVGDLFGQIRGCAGRCGGDAGLQSSAKLLYLAVKLSLTDAVLQQATNLLFGPGERRFPFGGVGIDHQDSHIGGMELGGFEGTRAEEGGVLATGQRLKAAV